MDNNIPKIIENSMSQDSFVNGTGKVHLNKKLRISAIPISFEFNKFYFKDIFKLLVNAYEETVTVPGLKVIRLYAYRFDGFHEAMKAKVGSLYNVCIDKSFVEFEYKGVSYVANLIETKDRSGCLHYCIHFAYERNSDPDRKIGYELIRLALSYTSSYKTGCMEISPDAEKINVNSLDIQLIEPPKSNFDNILISENITSDIRRFIYAFENFDKNNSPLRYLLSGKPGLGKTEVVRAVVEQCSRVGNVIIPKNMNGCEWLLFDFAKLFAPCVICIDDLDLMFGKREEGFAKHTLGTFLTALDGILENKVFIIATTNDKNLVDIAASRPGRFDEIIDFGDFEKRFYTDLIRQKTQNESIIALFDDEALDYMESKKVTGAYIVNLVKQLNIIVEMNPLFRKDDLMKYLQRNHKGFYKTQLKEENTFGFGGGR